MEKMTRKEKVMKKKIISLMVTLFVGSIILMACGGGDKVSPEMTIKWKALSTGIPQMVAALQSRVDVLSQSKKLPAGISKKAFEDVKAGLDTAKGEWTKAQESFKAGKVADAIAVGTTAKDKLVKAMEALKMTVPAGMKS